MVIIILIYHLTNYSCSLAYDNFNKAKENDLINEKRPEIFYNRSLSTQPIGPNLKYNNLNPYPQITNLPENPVLDSIDYEVIYPKKTSIKSYNSKNSLTSSIKNTITNKAMAKSPKANEETNKKFGNETQVKSLNNLNIENPKNVSGGGIKSLNNINITNTKNSSGAGFGPSLTKPVVISGKTPTNSSKGLSNLFSFSKNK